MVTVQLFAQLREHFVAERVSVDARTVAGLRLALNALCPKAAPLITRCRVAVNYEFVADDHAITPADEVALIPPVSGG